MTKKSFNLRNVATIVACLAVSFVFASCDPDDESGSDNNTAVESIRLNKTTLTIAIGESTALTATTVPANAAVTWTSDNDNAVVDANGKVTGKAEGTAVITAKAGDKTATCTVTVRGALINSVVWALRNVDEVGTFAATHENYGKFYQWGRKVAWNTTDLHATGWNGDYPEAAEGTEWAKEYDPSPAGWRVPTFAQVQKLLDQNKVDMNWTTQNGVKGFKFTDKANDASIFLPAVGYREGNGVIAESIGTSGEYWSSTMGDNNFAKAFSFNEIAAQAEEYGFGNYGKSIRPVLE
jgi:uncharacterized protein (TIGR02145 family)